MSIEGMKREIKAYEQMVQDFLAIGMRVDEDNGFYTGVYSIGVFNPKQHHGMPWLFSARSVTEFLRIGRMYLMGRAHEKEEE